MNSGKNDKKVNPMAKTMKQKKPNLEINVHSDTDPGVKSMPTGFTSFAEENTGSNTKSISTVNSPSGAKSGSGQLNEITEFDPYPPSKKKVQTAANIQKRGSGKQPQSPKVQLQTRISANQLTSPKGVKEKVLTSFGSQKNLGVKGVEKRGETPSKASKVDELQRILQEQKLKNGKLVSKENESAAVMSELRAENERLKEENCQLKKKIEKYKNINEDTKKMLKERIINFNEEGGELQMLKNQIRTLEVRVENLLKENIDLKGEINKFSDYNLNRIKDYSAEGHAADVPAAGQNMATSTVREVVPLQGSRISSLYLKDSEEAALKEFNGMDDVESNLDLQSYITEQEESYLDEYKTNVCIFDKIKEEYELIIKSMEERYKKLVQELQETISKQEGEFYQMELKNDQLSQACQGKSVSNAAAMALDWDEAIMRKQQEMTNMTLVLYDLKDQNKELIEDVEQIRVQYRFLQAELEVERMKKQFKDQNNKFQFNVVKLNLLNIIDKLKMQIDREKSRSNRFREQREAKVEP